MFPMTRAAFMTLAAFAAVYLIWGSTYLAIRVAIDTIPPLLMTGIRALAAGSVLLAIGWLRSRTLPSGRALRDAVALGVLLVACGNGGVAWAERTVPSGVAALVVATIPLWVAGIEWLSGARPRPGRFAGLALGATGVAVLVAPVRTADAVDPLGAVVLVLAALAWSVGTVRGRSSHHGGSLAATVGAQLLAGGVVLLATGYATGEANALRLEQVSAASVLAVAYLVVFGSLVAFSAYTYLLRVTTPGRAATYAFVNPLVAVLLGSVFAGEVLSGRIVVASGLILLGVLACLASPAGAPPLRVAPQIDVPVSGSAAD